MGLQWAALLLVLPAVVQAYTVEYVGCYKDKKSPKDLDEAGNGKAFTSTALCAEKCLADLNNLGPFPKMYFGLQHGQACLCGDSYGKYGVATNCDMACPQNASEICGGYWANSVYEIVVPPTPAPLTPATVIPVPTTAPPTPSPATDVPDTAVPQTPPPPPTPSSPTTSPDTPTPATAAPDTSAPPPTPAPPTPSPDTPTPLQPDTPPPPSASPPTHPPFTYVPFAAKPPTPAPPTATPDEPRTPPPPPPPIGTPDELSAYEPPAGPSSAVTLGIAAASGLAGGLGGMTAMRLALIQSRCSRTLPDALHPTGIEVEGSPELGLVIVNGGAVVALAALCCALLLALRAIAPSRVSQALALFRIPSLPLLPYIVFHQGLMLGAMGLLFHVNSLWQRLAGGAALLPAGAVMWFVWSCHHDLGLRGVYALAERHPLLAAVIGPGEWVDLVPGSRWTQRHAAIIWPFRQNRVWFLVVELAAGFALGALKSLTPDTVVGCGHVQLAGVVLSLLLVSLIGALQPHAKLRDWAVSTVLTTLQGAAMSLMAVGFYSHNPESWCFEVADALLEVSTAVLVVKAVMDLLTEGYALVSRRRHRLQQSILLQGGDCGVETEPATPSVVPSTPGLQEAVGLQPLQVQVQVQVQGQAQDQLAEFLRTPRTPRPRLGTVSSGSSFSYNSRGGYMRNPLYDLPLLSSESLAEAAEVAKRASVAGRGLKPLVNHC